MSITTEFAVDLVGKSCVQAVEQVLGATDGVVAWQIDVQAQTVTVDSHVPSLQLKAALETTGKTVAVKGQSASPGGLAAVCMLTSGSGVQGVVRFAQMHHGRVLVDGQIDGLSPGLHGLAVHEYGDVSDGWRSTGGHFNPLLSRHGDSIGKERHAGDLGNVLADASGRAAFLIEAGELQISDIIGRSLVVHEREDDLGRTVTETSAADGNAGDGVLFGIIARAASVFQNVKKVCSCDGTTIWQGEGAAPIKRSRTSPSSSL